MTGRRVVRVDVADAEDPAFVGGLVALVNAVYERAAAGLWVGGAARTSAEEVAGFVRERELYVLREGGDVLGCMRFRSVGEDVCEFGMLVAAPERRGEGIGRELLGRAVEETRSRGKRALRLELLVPREWKHPDKEFLRDWYGRNGFRVVGGRRMEEAYPHLAPMLATPCDLRLYEKPVEPYVPGQF